MATGEKDKAPSLEEATSLLRMCEIFLSRAEKHARTFEKWPDIHAPVQRVMSTINHLVDNIHSFKEAIDRRHAAMAGKSGPEVTRFMLAQAFEQAMSHAKSKSPAAAVGPEIAKVLETAGELCVFPGSIFTVAEVLQFLGFNRKTGTVRIQTDAETIHIELLEGDVISAWSTHSPPGLRLGEILIAQGAIDARTLNDFLDRHRHDRERLGKALEDEEIVPRPAIYQAIRYQVTQLFYRCMSTRRVPVEFRSRIPRQRDEHGLCLNLTEILLEGAALEHPLPE